jgi:hypothetical protein
MVRKTVSHKKCRDCGTRLQRGVNICNSWWTAKQYYCRDCHARRNADWKSRNGQRYKDIQKKFRKQLRERVLAAYGNKCACCGEARKEFLTIGHLQPDETIKMYVCSGGYKRRRIQGGTPLYYWIVKHNFPKHIRLECWNCNCAKGVYGHCPHERER